MRTPLLLALAFTSFTLMTHSAPPTPNATLQLWSGSPPGVTGARGTEHKVEGRPRPFYQLTDISQPTLEVFLPPEAARNGTVVLVCPGGGLQRLAYEHEGLEVASWLNSLGVTACVLKYRVPAPAATAVLDAQRAMGKIRENAARWGVDSTAVGIMGFSAGGEIAAWLLSGGEKRGYERQDSADDLPLRPDFSVIVYPGGLLARTGELKPDLVAGLRAGLPPVFLAHAFDDGSENSLQLALALKRVSVPCELHLFQEGAHGFGARRTGVPVDDWMNRCQEWMRSLGQMDPVAHRQFAAQVIQALDSRTAPPRVSVALPGAGLADAYGIQRRVVRSELRKKTFAGFKGGGASAAAQKSLGTDGPFFGILFREGWLKSTENPVIDTRASGQVAVETEIGYLMGTDFTGEILTDEQARDFVAAIVPVVELPVAFPQGPALSTVTDMIAANVSSGRFITGPEFKPGDFEVDAAPIRLTRDGQVLHDTSGGIVHGGQWHNLRKILNSATAAGYTIKAGSLVICGALGKAHPGEPGRYEARFGSKATIQFEIR